MAFRLIVATGPDRGSALLLRRGSYRIGKARDCDLVLTDPAVSRLHLRLEVLEGGVEIEDLESKNGSFFQGARFRQLVVGAGAALSIGGSRLLLLHSDRASEEAVSRSERFGGMVGQSLVMRRLFALLERVADCDTPVLIQGETGTGKRLCAESIHAASPRAAGPFVACDVSAVPTALLESALFGAFAAAAGGTLFIEEIGELGLELQPRILRALERREVKPVGAARYQRIDVRLIAASNRDLAAERRAGRLRADLYHRLAVMRVRLPPLRARKEDIPLLARHILEDRASELTAGALSVLLDHPWPGNVRELRSVLSQAASLVAAGQALDALHLGPLPKEDIP